MEHQVKHHVKQQIQSSKSRRQRNKDDKEQTGQALPCALPESSRGYSEQYTYHRQKQAAVLPSAGSGAGCWLLYHAIVQSGGSCQSPAV